MAESSINLAIIGSGPAGITAGIYAARKNLSVRVFESAALGGQTSLAIFVENYPGTKRIRGSELMDQWAEHLKEFGVEVEEANGIKSVKKINGGFELVTDEKETVNAKAVLVVTGTENKKLGIPGEKELYGKGISYCANCDGPVYKGKKVAVIGGGNSGVTNGLFIEEIAAETMLIEFMPELNCDEVYLPKLEKSKIRVLKNTQALEVKGEERVQALKVKDRATGKESEIAVDGIFIYVGLEPRNRLAKELGCKLDKWGFIETSVEQASSVKGVFAAGDIVSGTLAQTVWAAASGARAALAAYDFIKQGK